MRDRRDVIRLHLQNGISNLDDIRSSYNEFKKGGYTQPQDAIKSYVPKEKFEPIPISQEQQFNLKHFGQFNRPEQRQQTIQQPSKIKESQESKRLAEERINTRERLQKFEEQERIDKERELKVAPYAVMGLVGAATGTLPAMIAGEIGGRTVDYGSRKLTGKSWGENVLPEAPMIGELTNPGYIIGGLAGQYRNEIGNYIVDNTPLKDAYKLNPYAFKPNPEAYYRGIGRTGFDDAISSSSLRTANKTGSYGEDLYMAKDFNAARGNYSRDESYGVGNPFSDDFKMVQPKDSRSYVAEIPHKSVPNPVDQGFAIYNKGSLPIDDINFYRAH